MRFELIDRVLEQEGDSLTGIKAVTAAEEYLADHFPGFAVLPGVMMLEAMVQAARLFIAGCDNPPTSPLVVTQVRNVRYGNMVRPGQALTVKVTLRKQDEGGTGGAGGYDFQGVGTVDEQVAVQGRFRMEPLDSI
jgi:3-hydroxyacyl-[acyl-carrier-protein] dehydratase